VICPISGYHAANKKNTMPPIRKRGRVVKTSQSIFERYGGFASVSRIFGPGVNLAARMESLSEPMKITVSERTYELIKDEFSFEERGEMDVKGFGAMNLYFLESEHRRR